MKKKIARAVWWGLENIYLLLSLLLCLTVGYMLISMWAEAGFKTAMIVFCAILIWIAGACACGFIFMRLVSWSERNK